MDAVSDQESQPVSSSLQAILANLSEEICRPLERLHQGIESILADSDHPATELERSQASTMLILCEEIDRLTRTSLGNSQKSES